MFCKVEKCNKPIYARGYCRNHYRLFMLYGKPEYKQYSGGFNGYGYWRITINGNRVLEHRYIMEKFIDRPLNPSEKIHHINGIKTDNRIENLELINNQSEHMHIHHNNIWKKRKYNNVSINWSKYIIPEKRKRPRNKFIKKRKTCMIDECNRIEKCRNLCGTHFVAFRRFMRRKK